MAEAKKVGVQLDSTLESVDTGEEVVQGLARQLGFDDDVVHQIGMAVREGIVNAVVHGNCFNNQKKVTVAAFGDPGRLTITVQDQGAGFELDGVPNPLAEENLLSKTGRGLFLIRAFMDEIRAHRLSPQGMELVMVKNSSSGSKEDG